jgi:hypothetical protein
MASAPDRLLLAAPRGYCAGVDRAVQTVERALELYGAPVYVRKEIVHNKHVVEQLRERGAIFVEQETEVPEGETVVFSAHGVSPAVHANAEARRLKTIDATCPLVTKVHVEAKKFAAEGYTIVLIGHEGHEEVEGTMGEAPGHFVLVETEEDVDALELDDPERVAYLTQTTLSVDETDRIIRARPRRGLVPDRQRDAGAGSVARGQARGRDLVGGERSGGARPATGRILPRARHERRLGVRGRAGRRSLHAAQGDSPGAGRSASAYGGLSAAAARRQSRGDERVRVVEGQQAGLDTNAAFEQQLAVRRCPYDRGRR